MLLVHYGHHPGTTGVHFAEAARADPSRYAVAPFPPGHHLRLPVRSQADGYLWIESGASSYPLATHAAPYPTGGYLIDVHRHLALSRLQAALFDVVFVAQKDYVDTIRRVNPQARWLPLASPSSFLDAERQPRFDVGFVGQARPGTRREKVLSACNAHFGMNDWRRRHTVEEMKHIYRRSRIVVNDPAGGDVNMRFFEAMGSGAVVVTPALANGLSELAEEGQHYVVADMDDVAGLVDSLSRLLASTDLEDIGKRARALVAEKHTYEHRLATTTAALVDAPLEAPIRAMSSRQRARHLAVLADSIADFRFGCGLLPRHLTDGATAYRVGRALAKATKRKMSLWTGSLTG